MGAGSALSARLGGILEKFGRGKWISGRPAEAAIYLFLFGPSGLEWAGALPSRDALLASATESGLPELRLVAIVDDPRALERMRAGGHPAVRLGDLIDPADDPNQTCDFLIGLCKALSATHRPIDALFSACFADLFPRARRFMDEFGPRVIFKGAAGSVAGPRFLAGEIAHDHAKLARLLGHFGTAPNLFVCGNPLYFDHDRYLAELPNLNIKYLGWHRPPGPGHGPAWGDPAPGVWVDFGDDALRREAIRMLGSLGAPHGARAAFGVGNRTYIDGPPSFARAPEQAGGVLITDGSRPLLAHLSENRPVILVRSRFMRMSALARVSYFEGQGRWPVFASLAELAEAWSRDGLEAIWRPCADRRCSLEGESGPQVADAFIKEIYKPLLSIAAS